ncbi:response regulator [Foetidibacter luteolus]|uniref:response regulator n=1 Tax=Foetidibacter luteolus TaxID=2608880 RepID=UPI00129A2FBB|nr:response regulator [Foetidibacter luteolus]
MTKKKVYVADDDPFILELISIILNDKGYEVITSPDGRSLETLTEVPDLILLDISMSGSDGSEICKKIKTNASLPRRPVVLISANRNIQEIATGCGADDILPKPFDIKDVIALAEKYTAAAM